MADVSSNAGTVRLVESVARAWAYPIALEKILVDTPEEAEALASSAAHGAGGRRDIGVEARSVTTCGLT